MGGNSKIITVTCPKHHKVLTDGVWNYFNQKHNVDIKISCHKRSIEAHKMILELFVPSLVADSLFSSTSPPVSGSELGLLSIVDLGHAAQHIRDLETIVEFVYRGQVSFPHERLKPVLRTAKKLEVQLLVEAIEQCIHVTTEINGDLPNETNKDQDNIVAPNQKGRRCKDMPIKRALSLAKKKAPGSSEQAQHIGENGCNQKGNVLGGPCLLRTTRSCKASAKHTVNRLSNDSSITDRSNQAKFIEQNKICAPFLGESHLPESSLQDNNLNDMTKSWTPLSKSTSAKKKLLLSSKVIRKAKKCILTKKVSRKQNIARTKPSDSVGSNDRNSDSSIDILKLSGEESCASEQSLRDDSASESTKSWTSTSNKSKKIRVLPKVVTRTKNISGATTIPKKRRINGLEIGKFTAGDDLQTIASRAEYKKLWRKNRPVQKCPYCEYETRDKLRFKVHQSKHDPTVVIFKCETCGATFQSKESLDRHEVTHLGMQEIYRCPQCPYSSYKKINYHRHITAIHKIAADGKPLLDKYRCTECDFMCMYKSQFTLHVKMRHSSEKPFKCSDTSCNYASIRKGDLEKHYKTVHLHVRAYMCETCGHKSTHQGALNRHKISHSNVKNYECNLCDARYGHADQLKNHLQRHENDEKRFVCHLCAHSCRRRDNLQMHMKRIHKTTLDSEVLV